MNFIKMLCNTLPIRNQLIFRKKKNYSFHSKWLKLYLFLPTSIIFLSLLNNHFFKVLKTQIILGYFRSWKHLIKEISTNLILTLSNSKQISSPTPFLLKILIFSKKKSESWPFQTLYSICHPTLEMSNLKLLLSRLRHL